MALLTKCPFVIFVLIFGVCLITVGFPSVAVPESGEPLSENVPLTNSTNDDATASWSAGKPLRHLPESWNILNLTVFVLVPAFGLYIAYLCTLKTCKCEVDGRQQKMTACQWLWIKVLAWLGRK